MKIQEFAKKIKTVLFSLVVVSTAFNVGAVEAPNEPMLLSEFVRLASVKMKTNVVLSPSLSEEQAYVYGADKYSIENLFNAVLSANSLQVNRVDGVHILEKKNHSSAKYEMRMYNLEEPKPEYKPVLEDAFSYLTKTIGYECFFTQQSDYLILANCPKAAIPLVNNFFQYTNIKKKSVLVRAHIVETTNTDFYSVGFKYGLMTDNAGMSYKINENSLGAAIKSLSMAFSYDDFSTLISVLESDVAVKTVSRPSLLVDSGSFASFKAVQNIPVVSLVSEGGEDDRATTEITYQAIGVNLKVSPTVLSSGRVKLRVESEVSDIENLSAANQNPIFNSKFIDTDITISPNEIITIGGLISHDEDEQLGGVPLLKDIPIIGKPFTSTYTNKVKRELSIMLTVSVDEN